MGNCYCSSYHFGKVSGIFGVGIGLCLTEKGWLTDTGIMSRSVWGAFFVELCCGNGFVVGVGVKVVLIILVL